MRFDRSSLSSVAFVLISLLSPFLWQYAIMSNIFGCINGSPQMWSVVACTHGAISSTMLLKSSKSMYPFFLICSLRPVGHMMHDRLQMFVDSMYSRSGAKRPWSSPRRYAVYLTGMSSFVRSAFT